MTPTPDQLLEEAGRAKAEGREEDVRILLELHDELTAQPALAPTRPEVPVEPLELPQDRQERILKESKELAAASREGQGNVPFRVAEKREAEIEEILREEAERGRGRILGTGAPEPESPLGAVSGMVPFLRPTRIRTLPSGEQVYIEPDTGVVRPPSDLERLQESFARQIVTPEREIIRKSIELSEMPPEERETRLQMLQKVPESALGAGEVESSLLAALTPLNIPAAVLREATFGPSAREVKKSVQESLGRVLGPESAKDLLGDLSPALTIFGEEQVGRPAELERGESFVGRVGDILASREDIGDEFERTPAIVDRFKLGGLVSEERAKDAAYALGLGAEILIPIAPGAGIVTKGVKSAVGEGVNYLAPLLSKFGLEGVVIVAGRGANSDAALTKKVLDGVIRGSDLADSQKEVIIREVSKRVTPEAAQKPGFWDDIVQTTTEEVRKVAPGSVQEISIASALRRAEPLSEPLVRIHPKVAVPKSAALSVRAKMDEILKAQPEAGVRWIRERVIKSGAADEEVAKRTAEILEGYKQNAALQAAGSAARSITDVSVAQLGVEDALRGGILERAFPSVFESSYFRRYKMLDPMARSAYSADLAKRVRQAARSESERFLRGVTSKEDLISKLDSRLKPEYWPQIAGKIFGETAETIQKRFRQPEANFEDIVKLIGEIRAAGFASKIIPKKASRSGALRAITSVVLEEDIAKRIPKGMLSEFDLLRAQRVFGASDLDRKILAGGEEFARVFDELPVSQQQALSSFAYDTLSSAVERQGRLLRQAIKYGIPFVPNLPYLGGRALTGMTLPLVTLGLRRALGGAYKALRPGKNLKTPLGDLTPAEVGALADEYGLGISSVDAERVGLLADGLYKRIDQGILRKYASIFRDFIPDLASKIEQNFRLGVFRHALSKGADASEAAALARRSQVDWEGLITDPQLGAQLQTAIRFIPASVESAALMAEVAGGFSRNPAVLRGLLKAQVARNKQIAEENNLPASDAGISSIPLSLSPPEVPMLETASAAELRKQGLRFYAPSSPLTLPIEGAISVISGFSTMGDIVADFGALVRDQGVRDDWADRMGQALLRVPGIFAGREARSLVTRPSKESRLEDIYAGIIILEGSPALLSGGLDSNASQTSRAIQDILRPIPVLPPGADPSLNPADAPWDRMPPPGMYIIPTTTKEGKEAWLAFRPSPEGLQNLEIIRALTPAQVEDILAGAVWGPVSPFLGRPEELAPERRERERIERLREARK